MIAFDVTNINSIEGLLLSNLTNGFSSLTIYAKHLLYYFTAFEIICSGLAWAFYQNQLAERLFGQLLKIGLVFFLVENFALVLNSILASLLQVGQQLGQGDAQNILLNPGIIWEYGYNFSVTLLQSAASADGFALPMILMVLGFGILLTVGIFGIQIFIQVVAFYFVAAMSLLFLPLSVFTPLRDFFSQSMKSLLQASIRLMVQMVLVSAAVSVWSMLRLQNYLPTMNINAPLGFLFSGLLFVFASAYLPGLAEKVIAAIQWQTMMPTSVVQVSTPSVLSSIASGAKQVASAVSMTQSAAMMSLSSAAAGQTAIITHSPASMPAYINAIKSDFIAKQQGLKNTAFSTSSKYFFEEQQKEEVKKIKQAFHEMMKELQQSERSK